MRLPPWALQALRQGAADVARKASDDATLAKLREQASELFRDLPESASRGLDAVLKTAGGAAKEVVEQGRDAFRSWATPAQAIVVNCCNASGVLMHSKGTGVPVDETILQAGVELLRGDKLGDSRPAIDTALNEALQRDGNAIAVANNLEAALAALVTLADGNTLAIHRSHAIRLPSGLPLPDAFANANLRECGGVQSIELDDFRDVDRGIVVLADNGNSELSALDFSERDVTSVAVLPVGTLRDRYDEVPSAEVLLRNGFDLVVVTGGPLTGGVDCGIVIGNRSLVQHITQHRSWHVLAAADSVAAITLAALTRDVESPMEQLLDAGEDNLRGRVERMATRLAAVESVESTRITDDKASLISSSRWTYASRQLRIRHKSLSSDEWANQLAQRETAVIAAAEGDELVVDLRWVPPSADADLGDALCG
ncbi:MAG: hypothetical protein AAFX06_11425 [Planctomycetota bacterium]